MAGAPVLIAVGCLGLVAVGIFLEHYLGPKPKLNTEQLFRAFDLIDAECGWDYEKIRVMRESLGNWMDSPDPSMYNLGMELRHIISQVKLVEHYN